MQNERWQEIRRDLDPSWDELRERRVLGRVLTDVRIAKRAQPTTRARWMVAGAGLVAAAAAALVFWSAEPNVEGTARQSRTRLSAAAANVVPAVSPPHEAPANVGLLAPKAPVGTSTLRFADGSVAQLWADAQVVSSAQSAEEVVIEQQAGRVRYEVPSDEQRRFVVHAKNVSITVLATVFEVEMRMTEIEVRVLAGQVQVAQGERSLSLNGGESVRLTGPEETATEAKAAEPRDQSRRHRAGRVKPQDSKVAHRKVDAAPEEAAALDAIGMSLREADQARRTGDLEGASRVLQALIAEHGGDPRASRASFTLGRVERSRGRHREAARAFEACLKSDPKGPLAEDALAEAAVAWSAAGDLPRSRALAHEYLTRFASSTHSARIRTLLP